MPRPNRPLAAATPPAEARLAVFEAGVSTHALSRRPVETADGRRYQLFLAVPRREPEGSGFPVLYMLDGNAAFDALTPALLASAPGLALVGIGYDTPLRFDRAARSLDYTPPRDGAGPQPDPQRPDRMIGGAGEFLDRLQAELVPEAENGLPAAAGRRAIWGHSIAGLCVLFSLLTRPGVFSRHIAASPSIWWGEEFLLDLEKRTPASACGRSEVLVMLGDSERRSSPEGPHWEGPAPHTLEMIRRLARRDGLAVSSQIFEGAGHAATFLASLPPALQFASG